MDGIDAALVEFSDDKITLLASHTHELPAELKQKLYLLCQDDNSTNIDMLGETDTELGLIFADAVNALLKQSGTTSEQIIAIGSHGQTIRHRPDLKNNFSLQIGDANRISYNTGITTVADFRRKDMAAGGEGAPLAPAFHQQVFSAANENRAVLNIGGIANATYLSALNNAGENANRKCFGFDTGPGNTLMDAWTQKHKNIAYDKNGEWAASTTADKDLLKHLMSDRFITQQPPKSTGREHYNLNWLEQQLSDFKPLSAERVQATLCQFTCDSIVNAIENNLNDIDTLIVCGGGVHNRHLMHLLRKALSQLTVKTSDDYGVKPDWVEAIAFAWLARQTLNNLPGNIPAVTGASRPVVLGATYPA